MNLNIDSLYGIFNSTNVALTIPLWDAGSCLDRSKTFKIGKVRWLNSKALTTALANFSCQKYILRN